MRKKGTRRGCKKRARRVGDMGTKCTQSPLFGSRDKDSNDEYKEQYLFLMEFFVHRVTGDRLAKLNQMFFVPTSITFEFLDFTEHDGIEVTPVDFLFEPQAGVADDVEYFYSGKSVMFAMDRDMTTNKNLKFVVKATVRKRMPEGIKPDIFVGEGEFDLTKEFAAIRKEVLQCWHKSTAPPKILEGTIRLTLNGAQVGTMDLFVRMSAFGETIVTEFESPPTEEVAPTYVFKGDEVNEKSLAYKCRVVNSECVCQDSSADLSPCQLCVLEEYGCTPCQRATGARAKDAVGATCPSPDYGDPSDAFKPATYPPSMMEQQPKSAGASAGETRKSAGPIQTSRGNAQACGKAVVLKVSGLLAEDSRKQPSVTVAPESEACGPNNPPDPDHDVFILRIGKKGLVGANEKSDLQLEMRTPKGPERRPPIRHETREIQTDTDDRPKKDKRKKKKKTCTLPK